MAIEIKKSPLHVQKGTGKGSKTWIAQRFSALGLILLSGWFLFILLSLIGHPRQELVEKLQNPFHITGIFLFMGFSFYHGWLGLKEIVEDYVSCSCGKSVLLFSLSLFFLFLCVVGFWALVKLLIC